MKKSYLLLRVIFKIVFPFVRLLQYTYRIKINELQYVSSFLHFEYIQ